MSHPSPPSLPGPPDIESLCEPSGGSLSCHSSLYYYEGPSCHGHTGKQSLCWACKLPCRRCVWAKFLKDKSESVKWKQRRWIERDHAKEFRIAWGLVSTGIWFSGPRGRRWSETGRVWANLKGLYTLLMSFDFKDHRKSGKVLVWGYCVPTIIIIIIFWIHLPSHTVGCLGEKAI